MAAKVKQVFKSELSGLYTNVVLECANHSVQVVSSLNSWEKKRTLIALSVII